MLDWKVTPAKPEKVTPKRPALGNGLGWIDLDELATTTTMKISSIMSNQSKVTQVQIYHAVKKAVTEANVMGHLRGFYDLKD